jgi:hypothetical protein
MDEHEEKQREERRQVELDDAEQYQRGLDMQREAQRDASGANYQQTLKRLAQTAREEDTLRRHKYNEVLNKEASEWTGIPLVAPQIAAAGKPITWDGCGKNVRVFVEEIMNLVPSWQYFIIEPTSPSGTQEKDMLADLDERQVKIKKEYEDVMASTSDSTSATREMASQKLLSNRVRRIAYRTVIGKFDNRKGNEQPFIHRERLKFWAFLLNALSMIGGKNDHIHLIQDLLKGDIMGLFMILEKASGIRDYGAICNLKTQSELMFLNKGETGSKFLIRLKEMQRVLITEGMGWSPEEFIQKLRHGVGHYVLTMAKSTAGNLDFVYAKSPYVLWINTIESEERICRRKLDLPTLEASMVSFEKDRTKQFLEGKQETQTPKPLLSLETKRQEKPKPQKPLHVSEGGKVTLQKKGQEEKEGPTRADLLRAGLCFFFQTGKGTCHFGENCKYKHEKYDPKKIYLTEKVTKKENKIDEHGYGLFSITVPVTDLGRVDITRKESDIIQNYAVDGEDGSKNGLSPLVSSDSTHLFDNPDRASHQQVPEASMSPSPPPIPPRPRHFRTKVAKPRETTAPVAALWQVLRQGSPLPPPTARGAMTGRDPSPQPASDHPPKPKLGGSTNISLSHLSSTYAHSIDMGIYFNGKGGMLESGLDTHRIPALDTGAAVSIDIGAIVGDRNRIKDSIEMHTAQGGASVYTDSVLDRPYTSNIPGTGGGRFG